MKILTTSYHRFLALMCIFFCVGLPAFYLSAQQNQTVTGVTLDADGIALPGVNVVEIGTANGTTTGPDGEFALTLSRANAVLQFSYVGFLTQEIAPGNRTTLSVRMSEDSKLMDEVVVIGYGTQKKVDVTSAVSSVKSEDFNRGAILDAGQLIQGKVAGLQISLPTGDPTQTTSVMLRGNSTLMGTIEPLILVDGIPGSFTTVAPEDIESIDVLKDGSATAIYGTRGTNGVIIITTKTGGRRDTPATIEYNGYISASEFARTADFMTAEDLRQRLAAGYSFSGANDQDYGASTDWLKEISRTGFVQSHNLTFRGGGRQTNLLGNLTYEDRKGTFRSSYVENLRARFEMAHRMFDDKLITNLSAIASQRTQPVGTIDGTYYTPGGFDGEVYRHALIQNPTQPVYDADGAYVERPVYFYNNPVSLLNERISENVARNLRFTGSMEFRPVESLTFKAMYTRKQQNATAGSYVTKLHPTTTESGYNGQAYRYARAEESNLVELTANWQQSINQHTLSAIAGYNYEDNTYEEFNIINRNFDTDSYTYNKIEAGMALKQGVQGTGVRSYKSSDKLIGLFARATYNFDDRYLLMVSLRREGSSRFGADHKWGYFPGVSAGWRLNEEAFMQDLDWLNNLKLRAGYGITGINIRWPYVSLASLNYDGYFLYDGAWIYTLKPVRNPNPNLQWEKKYEYNLGVDFDFFNGRLGGSIDAYQRDTRDALWDYSVPVPPYQYNTITANVGQIENRGVEILLNAVPVQLKDLVWNTNVSFSTNTNKLVSISNDQFQMATDYFYPSEGHTGEPIQTYTHRVKVGDPIGNFYGLKSVGLSGEEGSEGKWVVERLQWDENKKNIIGRYYDLAENASDEDKQILGNGVPTRYLNWNNQVRYKNLDLSVTMRGAFGFQILNYQKMYYANPTIQYNILNEAFDLHPVVDLTTGKPTGQTAIINDSQRYLSEYIEDGDYWKIDNLTLGFTFTNLINSKYVKNLRVYASCMNLATFTGYTGIDPEVQMTGLAPGTDSRDKYPTIRSYTFGINVTF
ncbi:MAG: TonB-dependent receptor [Tannerellaceae bacterium]|nr:TonB-dependent receptor [Tannerellaceae bacterium]